MQNKSRKNNKKFLVIIAMILMIGLVSGMGAMTYSKYVSTTNTGTQTATAAKWGYVVTANADNLFGKTYKMKEATTATVDGTGTVVVQGKADAIIVAPGTAGSMTITLSGSAEVLAKVSFATEGETKDIFFGEYKPVKWTLSKKVGTNAAENISGAVGVDLATVLTKFGEQAVTLNPGETISETVYTLSWAWAFDVDEATNVKDTLIGYKAAGKYYSDIKNLIGADSKAYSENISGADDSAKTATYDGIKTEISFGLKVTIEQIQG